MRSQTHTLVLTQPQVMEHTLLHEVDVQGQVAVHEQVAVHAQVTKQPLFVGQGSLPALRLTVLQAQESTGTQPQTVSKPC